MQVNALDSLIRTLPKVPTIRGRHGFFHSAVLIPLVLVEERYHLLFQKRSSTIRQPGEICFPGGKFDSKLDARYRDTAVRECVEELGIDAVCIQVIGRLNTMIASMGAIIEPFLAVLEIADLSRLQPDPAEVETVFTIPVSFFLEKEPDTYHVRIEVQPFYKDAEGKERVLFPAKDLDLPGRYHRPWEGGFSRILVYRHSGDCIWGITAEIVFDLMQYAGKSATAWKPAGDSFL